MFEAIIIAIFSTLTIAGSLKFVDFKSPLEKLFYDISKGLRIVLDPELSDLYKELEIKKVAFRIIAKSLEILLKLGLILFGFSIGPLIIYLTQISETNEVFYLLISWEFILFTIIIFILCSKYFSKQNLIDGDIEIYSPISKSFHRIFMSAILLKILGRFDDFFYFRKKRPIQDKPIFIIGLARSGSTALLNALYSVPEFGTYTYGNMPLITSPYISKLLSYFSKRQIKKIERAHGDGHQIDLGSPEAFEEILWKLYFPSIFKKKQLNKIDIHNLTEDFELFFTNQVSKISEISVQKKFRHKRAKKSRYISKNNANISRLEAILEMFPSAVLLAPIRSPIEHANSLLNQHLKFLELQKKDPFILEYMNDLGHFEFGANHKPIALKGSNIPKGKPVTLNYWLEYWIINYKYLHQCGLPIIFVSLDDLTQKETDVMKSILKVCDSDYRWKANNKYFRESSLKTLKNPGVDQQLVHEAVEVYNALIKKSLF